MSCIAWGERILMCLGDNDNILSHSSPIKLNGSIKIQPRLPLIFIKQQEQVHIELALMLFLDK